MSLLCAVAALMIRRRAPEAPMPDDPNTPAPTSETIGDRIAASATAAAAQASCADAAARANAALAAANTNVSAADAALAAGLKDVGPVFMPDPASRMIQVFYPDTSPRGFHIFSPVPSTTALTVAPAPDPEPTPDPAP